MSYSTKGNGANKVGDVKKCDNSNNWPTNSSKTSYPDKKPSGYNGEKSKTVRCSQDNSWPTNSSKTSYPDKKHANFGTGG